MFASIIWDVNPEIFSIGSFSIRWYGLLFATGFILSHRVLSSIFRSEGKPESDVDTLTVYMVAATLLGARLGHFLFYDPGQFIRDPLSIIIPPYAGLASHGAAIGIFVALYLYSRRKEDQSYLWIIDRMVIVVALTGCCIRLGNLMNAEIIGKATDLPWGFVFIHNDEFSKVARHPAQLYEAIYCLLLFFFLLWVWSRKKALTPEGSLGGLFMIILFTLRFLDEYLKENQEPFENDMINQLGLNMGQLLSIPAVGVGVILLLIAYRRKKKPVPNT
jgi:prolipoprotein diacylglyceryl transferase